MKKFVCGLILCLSPLVVWGQEWNLDEDQVERALSCSTSDADCLASRGQLQEIVEALLVQVMLEQLLAKLDEEQDGYWMREEYLEELQEVPLREGRTQTFEIEDGEIVGLERDDAALYREMWRMFSTILTRQQRESFSQIQFYNDSDSGYAALVHQRITRRGRDVGENWELSINLANVTLEDDNEYNDTLETLSHEAGHFLLMNEEQVRFFVEEEECHTYYISVLQSCARKGSYYDVLQEFWDEEFLEWGEGFFDAFRDDFDDAEQRLTEYHWDRRDEFVSKYAASGPDEDAAETLAHFARYRLPNGELSIADQKIESLYAFDELLYYRAQVQKLMR